MVIKLTKKSDDFLSKIHKNFFKVFKNGLFLTKLFFYTEYKILYHFCVFLRTPIFAFSDIFFIFFEFFFSFKNYDF